MQSGRSEAAQAYSRRVFRDDCHALVRHALALLDAADPPPALPIARFAAAGLGTGLTAAIGALHEARGVASPSEWSELLTEQRSAVAARHRRFAAAVPAVLGALAEAGVDAVPVKGLVLADEHWPMTEARPVADVDLLVPVERRARAARALADAGFAPLGSTAWEDVFRIWGDGTVGRLDGESVAHDGKVELHPGWVERLHHYLVTDHGLLLARAEPGSWHGIACRRLDPAAFAAHVLGHLSASVVRCEVRALNILDVVVVARGLGADDRAAWAKISRSLDPRLVAPGAWLVHAYAPEAGLGPILDAARSRLPVAARDTLDATVPRRTFRMLGTRTDWAWRRSFATGAAEQVAVARQLVLPPRTERADRVRRVVGRARALAARG